MGALFLHPGFLIIAAALVSVPIIIHLINRMRFKRIRWAAMEFLLKAQKRTRRRLIIEQLILLALRCLMIALVGLLVSRFIGCGESNIGGKPNLHLVLLDDTPSMQDRYKEDGEWKNCLDVAKTVLANKIAKGLSLSRTTDQLIILPLSKADDPNLDLKEITYERLNDEKNLKEALAKISDLQPSMVHVNMLEAMNRAKGIIEQYKDSHVTLHLIGDFRDKDWGGQPGDALLKDLVDLAKLKKGEIKIRAIDTVHPQRAPAQGGFPPSRDNVGIVEIRPSTRIVGKNMPVTFTVVLKNYSGALAEVSLVTRDEQTGKDMLQVDYNPKNPIRIGPSSEASVTFEHRFNPEFKGNEAHFAHLSVRITSPQLGPLDNDGLLADNLRHTVVEVRDKVPILVVDGAGKLGREEGKDSFFISRALMSVPGGSYQVVYADELTTRDPADALERPDLNKYPTIFLLNVPALKPKQIAGLENFVAEGGGVAFFLGDRITNGAGEFNRAMYRDGKGIFPAPLKNSYHPPGTEEPLPIKASDTLQLITRDEKFKGDPAGTPIFGKIFEEPAHREPMRYLQIRRYWQIARGQWKPEPGRVQELATLPNDAPATTYQEPVAEITQKGESLKNILKDAKFAKYRVGVERHIIDIERVVRPGSESKAYHLANQIERLLTDTGSAQQKDQFPDLVEMWSNPDADVQKVKRQLSDLREDVHYGDPFIVIQNFQKGKVVAVMSTAGKEWNDWAGGTTASILYAPFVWELQNYLSSQGAEANLTTGAKIPLLFDAAQFKGAQLKLIRQFHKIEGDTGYKKVAHGDPQFGREEGNVISFTMAKHNVPGVYLSELVDENAPAKGPIVVLAHAFNIDTKTEGDLSRVGSDKLEQEFAKTEGGIIFVGADMQRDVLVSRLNDFSESPWLFLLMLLVLVAEQALAVHLSFHLKQTDDQLLPAGAVKH